MMGVAMKDSALEEIADAEERMKSQNQDGTHATYPGWSVRLLASICERSNIWYKETSAFTTLLGVAITCGQTSTISVRTSLSESEKIATIAHELGHIALGHTRASHMEFHRDLHTPQIPLVDDKTRELEASIWAAHLLVRPDVFHRYFAAWKDAGCNDEVATMHAEEEAATALNIPRDVVQLWVRHRHHVFAVEPKTWLQF